MSTPDTPRIVIVGAGPAGIRAAETLVKAGVTPIVIDEGARAGGQIYRRPPEGFTRPPEMLYGSEAGKARALHHLFDTMVAAGQVVHHPSSSVLALSGQRIHVLSEGGRRDIGYDRLLLATGASDRIAPVPGWQDAGVYSLGAVQIALKAQGVTMGRKIVLAGSGPLLTLVASQLIAAGAQVVAVLDTASHRQQLAGLSGMMARPGLVLRGIAMRLSLGRRYHAGVTLDEIEADANGPVAIRWRDARGQSHHTPCDMVGIGWHLRAETQLADLAGCAFSYNPQWSQWLPEADRMGRAGNGAYLAGDSFRILGADGAEISGRLAAAACLQDLGLPVPDIAADLGHLEKLERFAAGLAKAFPWPAAHVAALRDETVLCRCEGITAGEVRRTVEWSGPEINRVKSLGRVGMGRCQGRFCHAGATEIVAAQHGISPAEVGRLRGQAPVRPAPIGAWKA